MLSLRLGLGLLLRLRGLLRRLLLGFLVSFLLLASASNRAGGSADRSTLSGVAGDRADCCASRCTLGGTFYGPSLGSSGLLCRLLLCGLLLLALGCAGAGARGSMPVCWRAEL